MRGNSDNTVSLAHPVERILYPVLLAFCRVFECFISKRHSGFLTRR